MADRLRSTAWSSACQAGVVTGLLLAVMACSRHEGGPATGTATPPRELVVCDWAEGGFVSVRGEFEREYGVTVRHEPFESQEQAVTDLRAGKPCDVAIVENQLLPGLASEKRLAAIDFRNVPNVRNIAASFRSLASDPENRFSVPYSFGTTGILVRTDLVPRRVTRWSDLWDPRFTGKVAVRQQMRELVALTLLALGHPPNSEEPRHLTAALAKLRDLERTAIVTDAEPDEVVSLLASGKIWLLEGFTEDFRLARSKHPAIAYVLPAEGILLWSDSFVVPASARQKALAEAFINFMLRPEISARDADRLHYAVANEAARPLLTPDPVHEAAAYPPAERLRQTYFFAPLSSQGERLYTKLWQDFLARSR